MAHTDSLQVVTQAIVDLLKAHWQNIGLEYQEDVFFGIQSRYSHHPSIAVAPINKSRELNQMANQATNTFAIDILIYHSLIGGPEDNERTAIEQAEVVETLLHNNRQLPDEDLNARIVHSHCTATQTGQTLSGQSAVRTTRISWQGISKTFITTA